MNALNRFKSWLVESSLAELRNDLLAQRTQNTEWTGEIRDALRELARAIEDSRRQHLAAAELNWAKLQELMTHEQQARKEQFASLEVTFDEVRISSARLEALFAVNVSALETIRENMRQEYIDIVERLGQDAKSQLYKHSVVSDALQLVSDDVNRLNAIIDGGLQEAAANNKLQSARLAHIELLSEIDRHRLREIVNGFTNLQVEQVSKIAMVVDSAMSEIAGQMEKQHSIWQHEVMTAQVSRIAAAIDSTMSDIAGQMEKQHESWQREIATAQVSRIAKVVDAGVTQIAGQMEKQYEIWQREVATTQVSRIAAVVDAAVSEIAGQMETQYKNWQREVGTASEGRASILAMQNKLVMEVADNSEKLIETQQALFEKSERLTGSLLAAIKTAGERGQGFQADALKRFSDVIFALQELATNNLEHRAAHIADTDAVSRLLKQFEETLEKLVKNTEFLHETQRLDSQELTSKTDRVAEFQSSQLDLARQLEGRIAAIANSQRERAEGVKVGQRLLNEISLAQGKLRDQLANLDVSFEQRAEGLASEQKSFGTQLETHVQAFQKDIEVLQASDRIQIDAFVDNRKLLNLIHKYSYASAKRVAVSCGENEVLVKTTVGYVVCAADDTALLAALVDTGEYETGTRRVIERLLAPGSIFIDVGANVGLHTLAAARAMRGVGSIVAYEPFPNTRRMLEKTIWIAGFSELVEVRESAVASKSGMRQLYLGRTSGHHSLYKLKYGQSLKEKTLKVKTETLDSLCPVLQKIDLIKIDAEGAELDVIAGGLELLKENADVAIVVEFGRSHIQRTRKTVNEWFDIFRSLGLQHKTIVGDSGKLEQWPEASFENIATANLVFAREGSLVWETLSDNDK